MTTTAISTYTQRNLTPPFSADFPSEQINNSMETEEHHQTAVTTTTRMNTTHTASKVHTISEQPVVVVVVVVSDEDADTDTDTDTDADMK